ncbi:MAG: hypothetical protein JWO55_469 [Candidatus Saccharibacteria bacterium]|jgi:hypothetical protein|nr:hypothetical protein [Candidatus Saccharibacteria bacterium]
MHFLTRVILGMSELPQGLAEELFRGEAEPLAKGGNGLVGVVVDAFDDLSILHVNEAEIYSTAEFLGDTTEVSVVELEGRACSHFYLSFSLGEVRTLLHLAGCED